MARIDAGEGSTSKTKPLPKYVPPTLKPRNTTPDLLARPGELPKYNTGNQVSRPSWASEYEKAAAQRRLNDTLKSARAMPYLPMYRGTGTGYQQFDPAREAEINNYRANILTGKAFGYPGNYMTPGVMNQDYGYVRAAENQRTAPQREAWRQALDTGDASDRRAAANNYANTIRTFGGIGQAIGTAASNVASGLKKATLPSWQKRWHDVMNTTWPQYGPPAPDASPWVADTGSGGGGYDGYPYPGGGGYGGGGGGGGSQPSWMDMYQWRF